jgi:multiple sugar transport system substrate-binding protein
MHGSRSSRRAATPGATATGLWCRRQLLGAAAVSTATGLLAACGHRAAVPEGGPAPIELLYYPWQGWPNFAGPHWTEFIRPGLDSFENQNRGIRVKIGLTAIGSGAKYVAALLAGAGPDVFEDWAAAPYLEGGLVMDLSGYLQRDNVATTIWSPGQMHALNGSGGIWFLPAYIHVNVMAVNLSALDALGLPHPDPDWTYEQAAQLFRAVTRDVGGTRHPGVHFQYSGNALGAPTDNLNTYILHAFGARLMDETRTRCTLDDPKAVEAVQWFNQLYWDGVAGGNATDLANVPFIEAGSNSLARDLSAWANKFQWTYFPVPRFPAGRFSFEATDFHAVSAATKHPDESWLLIRFLSAEPWWSRFLMKTMLRAPSLVSLFEEYVTTVEAVAPPAVGKNLKYFTQAATSWGVANRVFRYQHANAITVINTWMADAFARRVDVATALRQAALQVNALESSGRVLAVKRSQNAAAFPTTGPAVAVVPAGV